MSTASDLEGSEDLEHVTLVRMEDVQPVKSTDLYLDDEMIENLEYDNECIIGDGDEDCAIGSMVPIKWGEVEVEDIEGDSQDIDSESTDCASDTQEKKLESTEDSNDTSEYIIPDIVKSDTITKENTRETSNKSPSSWPTLEILPGGVIKDADKYEGILNSDKNQVKNNEMVYACAKCPQKYKHLYCLVRHVKWHEGQEKKLKNINVTPTTRSLLKPLKKDVVQLKKEKVVIQKIYKLKCDKNAKIQNYTFPNRTKRKTNLS